MEMEKVEVGMYKGMASPTVEFSKEDKSEGIVLSLDSINEDLHNQSYGMMRPTTGCISAPGGPSC